MLWLVGLLVIVIDVGYRLSVPIDLVIRFNHVPTHHPAKLETNSHHKSDKNLEILSRSVIFDGGGLVKLLDKLQISDLEKAKSFLQSAPEASDELNLQNTPWSRSPTASNKSQPLETKEESPENAKVEVQSTSVSKHDPTSSDDNGHDEPDLHDTGHESKDHDDTSHPKKSTSRVAARLKRIKEHRRQARKNRTASASSQSENELNHNGHGNHALPPSDPAEGSADETNADAENSAPEVSPEANGNDEDSSSGKASSSRESEDGQEQDELLNPRNDDEDGGNKDSNSEENQQEKPMSSSSDSEPSVPAQEDTLVRPDHEPETAPSDSASN